MTPRERRLQRVAARLGASEQETLLAFAEFLAARVVDAPVLPEKPVSIPRPAEETVVGAIKRLSATYPMLDKDHMLHEISGYMAQHMLQGRPAVEVIDDLEAAFRTHFERHGGGGNTQSGG